MKQFLMSIPKSKALAFAAYAYTNEIRTLISWQEEGDFFGLGGEGKVVTCCVASEEKTNILLNSEWKPFCKNAA